MFSINVAQFKLSFHIIFFMKVIALTGNIGSGKTTVLKFVRSMHISVIDSDRIVASLYRDKKVQEKIFRIFDTSKRQEVASIAFSSPSKRRKLEKLLHPLVWRDVKQRLSSFRTRDVKLVVVEVPLLFEANWQKRFDLVIFVKSSKKKCLERLVGKGIERKDALLRWNAQLPSKKKIKSSQYIINNNKTPTNTRKQVLLLIKDLVK